MSVDETVPDSKLVHELCHELRSAITVIGGNAELVLLKNPDLENVVQPIITATDRLESIMQRLVG